MDRRPRSYKNNFNAATGTNNHRIYQELSNCNTYDTLEGHPAAAAAVASGLYQSET